MRRALVIIQFAMSITLLATAWLVSAQLEYLQAQPLGFHQDHMVILRLGDESEARDWTALRDDMAAQQGVLGAGTSQVVPGWWTAQDHVKPEGYTGEEFITVNLNIVCDQYVPTYGLEIIEGRNFDATRPADKISVIMNEAAMRTFGWDTATDKTMTSASGRTYPITGVIRDYHFMSLHSAVEPQILVYYPARAEFLSLRIDAENVPATLDRIREVWKRHRPDTPINIQFHEEGLTDWYTAEESLQRMMKAFTLLAAFISCLGLVGLTAHTLERRRREIGIRKVLGAQPTRLFKMLTREFVILMFIANVIGWPFAAFALRGWMQDFVVRMPFPFWIVPVLAIGTLALVILIIGGQTLRAVSVNPADIIREE